MTTPTNPPAGDMTAPSEGRRTRLGEVIYGAMFEVQIDLRYGGAEKAEYIADAVRRALEEADRVAAALAAKTTKAACTVWIGACNTHGYGVVQIDGVVHLAHRLAYEAEYGPIPDDMGIDHRCRVRNCVTPEHLEPVSAAENARRGRRASSLAVGDTCANGHLIGAGGLYERPSGKTECRLCRQSESSRKGIQRPTTQRRVADTRAAHARAS